MLSAPTVQQVLLGGSLLLLLAGNCAQRILPQPDAATELLTSHPWRMVAYTTTDNTARPAQTVNTYASLPASQHDDTYQFDIEHKLFFDDGPLRAATNDPQFATGKWQFQNNETTLLITLNRAVPLGSTSGSATSFDLRQLSADTLRLSSGPSAQTVVITLAR